MKTIEIRTTQDLEDYKQSGEVCNLKFVDWDGSDIYLGGAETGDIYLRYAETGYIYLRNAETKYIYLEGAETGYIYLRYAKTRDINLVNAKTGNIYINDAKTGQIIQDYTQSDIDFLKSLPIDIIDMDKWQSNDNWLECKNMEEIHTCGTTYCIRGYAEAQYFVENKVKHNDPDQLYPNLKHLFHMTNEQARKEINNIINNFEE